VADERDAQFAVSCKARLVSLAASRCYCRMAHQSPELCCAFPQGRIVKCAFDHSLNLFELVPGYSRLLILFNSRANCGVTITVHLYLMSIRPGAL
jgi:hypothetical protein